MKNRFSIKDFAKIAIPKVFLLCISYSNMIWNLHRFAYLGTTLLMYVTIYGKNVVLGKNRHGLNGFLSWLGWYFKINIHSFHSLRFHTSSYVTSVASVTSSRDGISQKDHLLSFSVYFLLFPYPKNFSQFFSSHWKK